jgi:hypothetical protein
MIKFACPECGEKMEIGERMAGREVRCVGCDEWIDVPQHGARRVRSADLVDENDGLSGTQYALFGLLFAMIPMVNVVVSSVLYYVWRSTRPRAANQINLLGFLIFGVHILLGILLAALLS